MSTLLKIYSKADTCARHHWINTTVARDGFFILVGKRSKYDSQKDLALLVEMTASLEHRVNSTILSM